MRLETLASPKVAVPRIAASSSGYRAVLPNEVDYVPGQGY